MAGGQGQGRGKLENTATQLDRTPLHAPPIQPQALFGPEPRTGSQRGSPGFIPISFPLAASPFQAIRSFGQNQNSFLTSVLHKPLSVLNTCQPLGTQQRERKGEGRVMVCCRIRSREEGFGERRQLQRQATRVWQAPGRNAFQGLSL